jgi:protein-disulfide isomerase
MALSRRLPAPARLAFAGLVWCALGLAPACKKDGPQAEPPAQASADAPPAPVESTVAEVDETGEIGIHPAQEAAGIPYVRFNIDVADAPRRGPDDAPVTIVMFSDFECPYCLVGSNIVKALERHLALLRAPLQPTWSRAGHHPELRPRSRARHEEGGRGSR